MEVGTGEFLVVGATAAGRAAGLGAKLGPVQLVGAVLFGPC